MRLRSIKLHCMGSIRDGEINLDALPPEAMLIGLVGDNGVGKSTTLDLWTDGTVERGWPRKARGNVVDVATERDSWFESKFSIGPSDYIVKHVCDFIARTGEAFAFDGRREPITHSGKLTEYSGWAKKNLPPISVLRSSIHSHPSYGSFVSMKPTARKDVILTALGVEHLEKLASSARKRADAFGVQAEQLRARIADEQSRGGNVEQLQVELETAQIAASNWERLSTVAEAELAEARRLATEYTAALASYQERHKSYLALENRRDAVSVELDDVETRLTAAVAAVERIEPIAKNTSSVERAQRDLAVAQDKAKDSATARALYDEQMSALKELQFRCDDSIGSIARIRARMVEHKAIVAKSDEIQKAVSDSETATEEATRLRERITALESEYTLALRAVQEARVMYAELSQRFETLRVAIAGAEGADVAAARLLSEEEEIVKGKELVRICEERLERLRGKRLADKDGRIVALRKAHETVAAGGLDFEELQGTSVDALYQDDSAERDAVEIPKKIFEAEEHLQKVKRTNESFERMVTTTRELAAKSGRLATDRVELEIASNGLAALTTQGVELAAQAEAKKSAVAVLKNALGNLETIIDGLRGLVSQADQLKRSEAALAELNLHEQAAVNELATLEARLAVTPEPVPPSAAPDVAALTEALRLAKEAHDGAVFELTTARVTINQLAGPRARLLNERDELARELAGKQEPTEPLAPPSTDALEAELRRFKGEHKKAVAGVGTAEQRLQAARDAAARALELQAQLTEVDAHQSDWTRLGIDLGRKGLQAVLVGTAGPELTAMSNDLLQCFGSRWSLLIADGQEGEDKCEIHVLDSQNGHEGTVEDLSDGEKSIVGEAVSLALSILACRHAHFDRPTLIRDESSAALNEPNRAAWMRMLRKAAEIVNADRVLIVSHSKDVVDMCDARYLVADGTIRLMREDEEYVPASATNYPHKEAA